MATIARPASGNWRAQARRKGVYLSDTSRRRKHADSWPLDILRRIDRGEALGALRRPLGRAHDLSDLHLHDLGQEATSRLFEAGLTIENVALVAGRKDWRMLRRYTNLKPTDLHRTQKSAQISENASISSVTGEVRY